MSDYPGKKNDGDIFYWLIALGLILIGVTAPVGVLMIVMKLLGGGKAKKRRQQGRHPYYQQQYGREPAGARTTQEGTSWEGSSQDAPARQEPVQKQAPLKPQKKKGKGRDLIAELDKKGKSWAIAGGATAAG